MVEWPVFWGGLAGQTRSLICATGRPFDWRAGAVAANAPCRLQRDHDKRARQLWLNVMQLNAKIGGRNLRRDWGPPGPTWAGSGSGTGEQRAVRYSVVVPVYNSAAILPELHRRLSVVLAGLGQAYEIIFVDDCGPQDCWSVLSALAQGDARVKAIQLMRNSGQSNATLCGLAHAQGEFIVMMDDDLQHPPEQLPRLINALTPQVDVVMGVPRDKQHAGWRCWGSAVMHRINTALLHLPRGLRFSSFRLLRRPVVDALLAMHTQSPALSPMIFSVTRRIVSVEVDHAPRAQGRSGYTLGRLVVHASNNLVGYSNLPLRLLAALGGVGLALSVAGAAALVLGGGQTAATAPGWVLAVLLVAVLASVNFLAFALLGEYLLRLLQRANGTPRYLVRASSFVQPSAQPSAQPLAGVVAPQPNVSPTVSNTVSPVVSTVVSTVPRLTVFSSAPAAHMPVPPPTSTAQRPSAQAAGRA